MKRVMRRVTVTALALVMALSVGGCGSTADLAKKLGEAAAKALKEKSEQEQQGDAPDVETAEPTASPEELLVQSQDKDGAESEPTREPSAVVMPTPREGVTGLDDIFSGSGSSSKDEIDSGISDYFGDDYADSSYDYDTFVSENLEKCRQDLEADKGPVQSEVESDTIQWFNATYAVLTESNNDDRTLVGGMERDLVNAVFMRYQLYVGWGIDSREDADEVIEWLSDGGHRDEYEDMLGAFEEIGLMDAEEEYFDEIIEESFGEYGDTVVNRLQTIYDCNEVCGEKGILAWDLCRVNQVAAWCYVAGYYTLEESLEIQLQNSKEMQSQFSSWDEMMESYLYGYQYWNGDPDGSAGSDTAKRRNIYTSLKGLSKGPYSAAYDLELLPSWGM